MSDVSQTGMLDAEEFFHFYKMLTQRTEIIELFQEYSSDGQVLSHCDLEEFLREEQLEGERSQEHALKLIQQYEPSNTGSVPLGHLSFNICMTCFRNVNEWKYIKLLEKYIVLIKKHIEPVNQSVTYTVQ